MLAIDRLKRIQSGLKRLSSATERRGSTEMLDPPTSAALPGRWSGDLHHPRQPSPHFGHDIAMTSSRMPSGESLHTMGTEMRGFANPRDEENARNFAAEIVHMRQSKAPVPYKPDMVAIQVRSPLKGASTDALDSIAEKQPVTYHSFHGPIESRTYVDTSEPNVDGDVTPTNERGGTPSDEIDSNCSTLRRPAAMVSPRPKPKPIAKIVAKSKRVSCELPSDIMLMEKADSSYTMTGTMCKSAVSSSSTHSTEQIYAQPICSQSPQSPVPHSARSSMNSSPSHSPTHYAMSPLKNKRMPPPPPKRTNSIKSTDNMSLQQTLEARRAELTHSQIDGAAGSLQGAPPTPPPPPPPAPHAVPVLTSQTVPMSASLPAPGSSSLHAAPSVKTGVLSSAMQQPHQHQQQQHQYQQQQQHQQPQQSQADFSNCVKSLADKFNKPELQPVATSSRTSTHHPQPPPKPSPGEDFPPPPPPIAMQIITPYKGQLHNSNIQPSGSGNSGAGNTNNSNSSSTLPSHHGGWGSDDGSSTVKRVKAPSRGETSASALTLSDRDSSSSTSSIDSNASTSSVESNTLPFANENVGTIKQRAAASKPSILSAGGDVDTGDRNLDSSLFEDGSGTIKRGSPLHRG